MELTVKNEQEMSLLGRKDYVVRAHYQGATPPRAKIRDELAKKLGAKKEFVIVKRINPEFGASASVIEVSVYKDVKALELYESEYIITRHGKEAPAEEKPAEPVAEEVSAEKAEEPAKEGDA